MEFVGAHLEVFRFGSRSENVGTVVVYGTALVWRGYVRQRESKESFRSFWFVTWIRGRGSKRRRASEGEDIFSAGRG